MFDAILTWYWLGLQTYNRCVDNASSQDANSNPMISLDEPRLIFIDNESTEERHEKLHPTSYLQICFYLKFSRDCKCFVFSLFMSMIAKNIDEARRGSRWAQVMQDEMKVLIENKT